MALARVWKLIHAEGDDIPTAKRIYAAMAERFVGKPARGSPVQQWIIDEGEWAFVAITNAGWNWLDLEAWKLGRPGCRRYIMTMDDFDDETRDLIIQSGLERLAKEAAQAGWTVSRAP